LFDLLEFEYFLHLIEPHGSVQYSQQFTCCPYSG